MLNSLRIDSDNFLTLNNYRVALLSSSGWLWRATWLAREPDQGGSGDARASLEPTRFLHIPMVFAGVALIGVLGAKKAYPI